MAYSPTASNPRRMIGFVGVVLLHILIIWAFANGLVTRVIDVVKGPVEAKLIQETKVEKEEPPPPPPKFTPPPPPTVIMPEISIEAPPEPSTNAITAAPARPQAAAPAPQIASTPPRSNPRRPLEKPDYPATSKRLGEQGTVVMLLTIGEDGKVTAAKVTQSCGYERLDQAAVQWALQNWRFLPGTVNGKPVSMDLPFKFKWDLKD